MNMRGRRWQNKMIERHEMVIRVLPIVMLCIIFCGLIVCSTKLKNKNTNDIKIGKNITIEILDGENVSADYLRNILKGTTVESNPFFIMMDDKDLERLIEYMEENKYKIGAGTYTINQGWRFDNGEFVTWSGEKRKIFVFEKAIG